MEYLNKKVELISNSNRLGIPKLALAQAQYITRICTNSISTCTICLEVYMKSEFSLEIVIFTMQASTKFVK